MNHTFSSEDDMKQKTEAIEKLEIYLNQVKAIAALKQKTGAPSVGSFKPFLNLLEGFLQLNSIDFKIPELRVRKHRVNSQDIQPFINRFSGFIEEVKSSVTL